jgi:hypothetical protein
MKRNNLLLAKSLAMGLAVATAVTSMGVPGGLLTPVTAYAKEANTNTITIGAYDSTAHTLAFTVEAGTTYNKVEYVLDGGESYTTGTESTIEVNDTSATLKLGNKSYAAGSIKLRYAEDEKEASDATTYNSAITVDLAGSVAISGTEQGGGTLTATVTPGDDQDGLTYNYTWYRGQTVVAENSASSTTDTYVAKDEDIGSALSVTVTVDGYSSSLSANTTGQIAKKAARTVGTVSATPEQVGETYTVKR